MSEESAPQSAIGEICWFEIAASDMNRAKAFYKTVFGWEFANPPGMDETEYAMFQLPGTRLSGGIHRVDEGKVVKVKVDDKGEGEATNRITWKVQDVATTLATIKTAGGEVIREKFEVAAGSGMGYLGIFRDTEGNLNTIWSQD